MHLVEKNICWVKVKKGVEITGKGEWDLMSISVAVPKDLSGIKTKVAFNLTKRQIICFGGAAATGIPLYFLTRDVLGTEIAAVIMVAVMLPFFFLAMYEKNGFPAEKILYFIIRQKFLTPGIRPYRSESMRGTRFSIRPSRLRLTGRAIFWGSGDFDGRVVSRNKKVEYFR